MKQTAVEWLIEQIKYDQNKQAFSEKAWTRIFELAKEMDREQMASNCSQVEISDEEIESKASSYFDKHCDDWAYDGFVDGAKWCREKLKQK